MSKEQTRLLPSGRSMFTTTELETVEASSNRSISSQATLSLSPLDAMESSIVPIIQTRRIAINVKAIYQSFPAMRNVRPREKHPNDDCSHSFSGLPGTSRCDGIVQCSDLRDEANCGDYATTANRQGKISYNEQSCVEQRFNPFRIYPQAVDSSLLDSYASPNARLEYLNLIFYLQLAVFYGVFGGLIFLLLAVITLFFFGCCRRRCISVPFYFYGLWMLFAWLLISTALVAFVFQWLWQKQTVLDSEKTLPLDVMIHESNPNLRNLEFFGLSFWLACGAALATFLGLLLSYCVCCTVGSSRADDKEYEIMQMHNY